MKVTYIDHMGSDLSVVNAARVSFSKESDWEYRLSHGDKEDLERQGYQYFGEGMSGDIFYKLEKDDARLINYLAIHEHTSPFRHTAITLHVKAPIFIARQLGKHQVGMSWNEVSRRYVDSEPELFYPDFWRERSEDKKQGSEGKHPTWNHGVGTGYLDDVYDTMDDCVHLYEEMVACGVCPEQARMVLPQSMYTEWYWTGSLLAFYHVYRLRSDPHAQKEVQDVAMQIKEVIEPLYPVSWKALENAGRS